MKKFTTIIIGLIIFFGFGTGIVCAADDLCTTYSTAKDGFFVVLEEPMGQTDGVKSAICYRACYEKTNGVIPCVIQSSCTAQPDSKGKTQGEVKTCQRIQIIKAETGADLLYTYIGMIYKWAAGTIGIIAVFTMVYSGVLIIASNGNSEAIEGAKDRITKSIAGLVVLFLSGLILYSINPTFFV